MKEASIFAVSSKGGESLSRITIRTGSHILADFSVINTLININFSILNRFMLTIALGRNRIEDAYGGAKFVLYTWGYKSIRRS